MLDDVGFERLLAENRPRLLGFAAMRVHDADAAEDLAQKLLVKLWGKRAQYDASRPFLPWARFWLCYLILEHDRTLRRRRRCEILQAEIELRFADEVADLADIEQALGAPVEAPALESARRDAAIAFERFLLHLGSRGDPPHQLVVFGFVKLLGWKPAAFAVGLSDWEMQNLGRRLEGDLGDALPDRRGAIATGLSPLRRAMGLSIGTSMWDGATRQLYPVDFLAQNLGLTIFRCFYTDSEAPTKNISEWCYSVRRRHVSDYVDFFED